MAQEMMGQIGPLPGQATHCDGSHATPGTLLFTGTLPPPSPWPAPYANCLSSLSGTAAALPSLPFKKLPKMLSASFRTDCFTASRFST